MRMSIQTVSRGVVYASLGMQVLLCVPAVNAQPVPPQLYNIYPQLNRDDLDRMQAAAARLYEGRSIGTVERWRNPDSGDAGSVELLESTEVRGVPCRRMEYTVRLESRNQQLTRYVLNWCQTAPGEWKIVEQARRG